MKPGIVPIYFLVIALSLFIQSCNEPKEAMLESILEQAVQSVENGEYPSMAVAVAVDGKVVFEDAFGWANIDKQIKADEHTMYSLASISKPITATGLMILVERGLIDLDKPVNDYLGDAKLNIRVGEPNGVTVRRVASHTAGLPLYYHFFYEDEPYRRPSMDETIRKFGNVVYQPDDLYQYSNFGYGVLDYIIERVSEKTYPDFLRDEVFIPLGMNNTAVLIPQTYTGKEAVRYDNEKKPIPFYDFDHRGGSAVYASAHDLIRFGLFHLNQLQRGQQQILSPSTIEKMQSDVSVFGNYAIGWDISEQKGFHIVQHTGGMGGVRTTLTLAPEMNAAIVVLTNCENGGIFGIKDQILDYLISNFASEKKKQNQNDVSEEKKNETININGNWRGVVQTYIKEMPVELMIKDASYQIQFNNETQVTLNEVSHDGKILFGKFLGDIQTPDEFNPGNKMELKVVVDDNRMYGVVTSMGEFDGKNRNALSHFVSFTRLSN